MRNAFVVLVSLCIGVVSGFIVPKSTPEKVYKNNITEASRNAKVHSMVTQKSAVLPKNRTNIDEKDLFEHATEKRHNKSERAYVYINQKYNRIKYPWNKLIKMVPDGQTGLTMDKSNSVPLFEAPPPTLMSAQQIPCVTCLKTLSPVAKYNTKYQGFHLEDSRHGQESILGLTAPDMFRWTFSEKPEKKGNVLKMPLIKTPNFLELLKSPLLRPQNRQVNFEKVKISNMDNNIPIVLPSRVIPNSETFIKEYLENQYVNKFRDGMTRNEVGNKYGLNAAFVRRPNQIEEVGNRAEELIYINEDENRKKNEIKQDDDGLLDKYLKDSLDDNVPMVHYDRVRALPDLTECDQEDCTFPSKKLAKSLIMEPVRTFGRNQSLKDVESFISNDRSIRKDQTDRNETALTSTEVINYGKMLSEELNVMKGKNYVIRSPNTRASKSTVSH